MSPHDRERLIIAEATRYFAEYGFSGGTIELARRIGVTQPLLYRYFPTKEALIERVFDELFPHEWAPRWEAILEDTALPLRDRLKTFYKEYAKVVLSREHVRLFLYSGLSKFDFNMRYYDILTERIFVRIAHALWAEYAPTPRRRSTDEIGVPEFELIQTLHAAIYHVGFRKWVHNQELHVDLDTLIDMKVDFFMDGAERTIGRLANEPRERSDDARDGA